MAADGQNPFGILPYRPPRKGQPLLGLRHGWIFSKLYPSGNFYKSTKILIFNATVAQSGTAQSLL